MTLSYGLWDTYVHEVHIMYLHESLRHDYIVILCNHMRCNIIHLCATVSVTRDSCQKSKNRFLRVPPPANPLPYDPDLYFHERLKREHSGR
jgi:hypothetical protein